MLRHIPQPLNTRRFQPHIRIQSMSHSMVSNGLFLFIEQFNHPPLGANEAADTEVGMVKKKDNGLSICLRWYNNRHIKKRGIRKLKP